MLPFPFLVFSCSGVLVESNLPGFNSADFYTGKTQPLRLLLISATNLNRKFFLISHFFLNY